MDALGGLFGEFVSWLYESGAITVPEEFHSRVSVINTMMDMEVTGLVSTITNYAITSAKEAEFTVECSDQTIEDLLNLWLKEINVMLEGIPTGINELAGEYYKERWTGSSLCLMRVSSWKKISIGANSITVPTVLWFVNGGSIWIHRPNEKNYALGTDKYFLDETMEKLPLPNPKKDEKIIVQKPFDRYFTKYPSPYLIKNGTYKNWKALEVLQGKSDEVIAKFLPYMLLLQKGNIEGFKEGIEYDDKDMKLVLDNFKEQIEKYHKEKGKVPVNAIPFDQKYEHLIPDLKNILNEELYNQGSRAILSGLGFVDVIQGISSTRKESVLNPKPFIAEVNAGVAGFQSMLMEVIRLIIKENGDEHRKLFSGKNPLRLVHSKLRINIDQILDAVRSGFVYGGVTFETYHESLDIDHDQEIERMKKEWEPDEKTGLNLRDLFYPHIIQNTEDKGLDTQLNIKIPTTKKQIEKQKEKTKGELEVSAKELFVKCSKCENLFDYLLVPEAGMGYVKCPKCGESVTQIDIVEEANQIINEPIDPNLDTEIAPYQNVEELLKHQPSLKKYPATAQRLFMHVWNSIYKQTGSEARAFAGAWSSLKKWMKRHNKK